MINHILSIIILCLAFTFSANSQPSCEQILEKKNHILMKSFENSSFLIEQIDLETAQREHDYEARKARLMIENDDLTEYNKWRSKAEKIKELTTNLIHHLLEEMNTIAQLADETKNDYLQRNSYTDKAYLMKSLRKIKNLENREIPTMRLVGKDINQPNPVGMNIEEAINKYKNEVIKTLANYRDKDGEYVYTSNFSKVNPMDEHQLKKIKCFLKLEEVTYLKEKDSDETHNISWLSDNFYYSSLLETSVVINHVISEIKLIEKEAFDFTLNKFSKFIN